MVTCNESKDKGQWQQLREQRWMFEILGSRSFLQNIFVHKMLSDKCKQRKEGQQWDGWGIH